nr:MAG TPA: hypothetical protein [Caudoviricetes sp.]
MRCIYPQIYCNRKKLVLWHKKSILNRKCRCNLFEWNTLYFAQDRHRYKFLT